MIYIDSLENPIQLWIVELGEPSTYLGYIESTCKQEAMLLQINVQKKGYEITSLKPRYCSYARGIPYRFKLGKGATRIEFVKNNEALLAAVRQTAESLKLEMHQINPIMTEAIRYKKFSNSPSRFPFKEVKNLIDNPDRLVEYFKGDLKSCGKLWKEDLQRVLGIINRLTNNFSDPDKTLTLYRGVVIFDLEPDTWHPGMCWSYEKEGAIDWVLDLCEDDDDPDIAPCILKGVTSVDNVDWLQTISLLLGAPEEREIRVWEETEVDVVDWWVL